MSRQLHTAEGRLVVDLLDLPPEGREFAGEIHSDFFQLEPGAPQPIPPLRYRLRVEWRTGWLVVTGEVSMDFEFECVLCLERFRDRITLDGYLLEEEITEKTPSVDLTDRVREDILLALPGYPHCNESTLEPRECPAASRFLPASSYAHDPSEEEAAPRPDLWGALDQLDIKPAPGGKKQQP